MIAFWINPSLGLDQAIPYAALKACGKLSGKAWRRLDREIEAAIEDELIPKCLRGEVVPMIERIVREPIGYAAIEKRAAA